MESVVPTRSKPSHRTTPYAADSSVRSTYPPAPAPTQRSHWLTSEEAKALD
ncbi:MAG TPA: hypothetical protein VK596_06395 [Edaphobacter sp.]|nr:hypothetical protein [Edaphobacter sp.]